MQEQLDFFKLFHKLHNLSHTKTKMLSLVIMSFTGVNSLR